MSIIAVAGLGYVGFPLAVEFGKVRKTIGFDLSKEKIESFKRFIDPAGELTEDEIRAAKHLTVTTNPELLSEADYIIVAVPTPIDAARRPDLEPAGQRQPDHRPAPEKRRNRHLRINRLPRRNRGNLHPRTGGELRAALEEGLPRGLFPRAHQPRRQGKHPGDRRKGGLRRRRANPGQGRRPVLVHRLPPASTAPHRSRWQRPPRSSKTPSAT